MWGGPLLAWLWCPHKVLTEPSSGTKPPTATAHEGLSSELHNCKYREHRLMGLSRPPIPSLCFLLVGTKHPSLPPLCVPFQPCLGTLAGKDGSIAKANVHPLLKRDYYWESERRNLTMMWQVVSHCQSALRDPTPAGFALCPSPPGAVTSPGTNIRAIPNSQLCGQSPPRSSASPTAGRKALGDIPLTSHSHSFAVSCTHCFQCPQRQQDTHTTTSSRAKQEPSSTSYSAATGQTGQYPRAWLINAMAYNYSLQSDSEIKRFPPLS